MSRAVRQPATVAAVGLLLALAAQAQHDGARCDALPGDAEKLRCFRAVVRELEDRLAGDATDADDRRRDTATPASESEAPAAPDIAAGGPAADAPQSGDRAPAAAREAGPRAAVGDNVAVAGKAAAEANEARRAAGPPRPADERFEIAHISRGPLGNLTVRLANGEVWRQLDSDNTRVRLPDELEPRYAVIEEGFLGSRRMRIVGTARSFRVRRVD